MTLIDKIIKKLRGEPTSQNKELVDDFQIYCKNHPEQRFWQALCNWSGQDKIMVMAHYPDSNAHQTVDTFYWEKKSQHPWSK